VRQLDSVRDVDSKPTAKNEILAKPGRLSELRLANLDFESDIGHRRNIGTRLVDDSRLRNDPKIWEELLRYRQRRYGKKEGALHIWFGMTQRLDDVRLPVTGEQAQLFWKTFVTLGLDDQKILSEIVLYARQLWQITGERWSNLYEAIIGGLLRRGLTDEAVRWHHELAEPHLAHPDDVLCILEPAFSRDKSYSFGHLQTPRLKRWRSSRRLQAFMDICRAINGHKIYKPVLSRLLSSGRLADAVAMHRFLINQKDLPESQEDITVLLEHLRDPQLKAWRLSGASDFEKELMDIEQHLAVPQNAPSSTTLAQTELVSSSKSDGESSSLGEEHRFSDELLARFFATKAFSTDMVLSGLQMFNVPAIGPLSLREMGLRSNGSKDLLAKIETLHKAGISLGESLFTKLVLKLASESRDIMLHDLLHNDQHPDIMNNADLQESLLVSYYMARDWRSYSLTVTILGEILKDDTEMLNIHFRKHIVAGEWATALKALDHIHRTGKLLSRWSIDLTVNRVLTPRTAGKPPPRQMRQPPLNEEQFLMQVLKRVADFGGDVEPQIWVEILKRLGMRFDCKWDDICNLCRWIADHYTQHEKQPRSRASPSLPIHTSLVVITPPELELKNRRALRRIFSPQMQMALVTWGFKIRPILSSNTPRSTTTLSCDRPLIPWARGLSLLRELKQKGVWIWSGWVRRAYRQRLKVLYGSYRSSTRRSNQILRKMNPYPAHRLHEDMTKVWGNSLFLFEDERK
jgi:hypothetical protein